jgi:RNA polymerase sigma-70 factor, ECF subfamily
VATNADAEALFAAHQTGLLRYLCRAVGHAETARDLTQDVFVRIARSDTLPATDDERRAWLFRIARNLAIDHRRRLETRVAGRAARVEDRGGGNGGHEPGRPASQDTTAVVNEALAAIDALDRDVFLLREAGGLSYAEIAAACDLTVSAVRSRIHRARLALRERLRDPIAAVLKKDKG